LLLPLMAEVAGGVATSTTIFLVWAVPDPQSFDGVTVMMPDVLPVVTVTVFVPCPPVTDHPAGTAQV
jgi:hypothetical protein